MSSDPIPVTSDGQVGPQTQFNDSTNTVSTGKSWKFRNPWNALSHLLWKSAWMRVRVEKHKTDYEADALHTEGEHQQASYWSYGWSGTRRRAHTHRRTQAEVDSGHRAQRAASMDSRIDPLVDDENVDKGDSDSSSSETDSEHSEDDSDPSINYNLEDFVSKTMENGMLSNLDADGNDETHLESLIYDASATNPAAFPPTYLVVRLGANIKPEAITWLVKKINGKKQDGGAELLVRCEPFTNFGKMREGIVLHVTASKLKFLEVAEYLELKKVDCNGVLREFSVVDLDNFLYRDIHLDNLLTPAEKQMIVLHELENIRAQAGNDSVPGYPSYLLHRVEVYLEEGLVAHVFPLHNTAELEALGAKWYLAFFQAQPFEDIRRYFGDALALYFSFLGYYTTSLFIPAVLGLIQFLLPESSASSNSLVFFCIFNVIWVTISQEIWKRQCSELAYVWGNLRMTKWEEPRANFRGKMAIDPVTGRYQPKYPWWKTAMKAYCVSLPIVMLCLLGSFWIMLYSFWAEEFLIESKQRHGSKMAGVFVMLPSIIYAALVWVMNFYYRKFANYLTEWENHRTQGQFERHRVTKLVLFEFVNNFMSLFYIAFYIQDLDQLRYQVTVMLIIMQFINNFQEALLPLIIKKGYNWLKADLSVRFPKFFADTTAMNYDERRRMSEAANQTDIADPIWSPAALGLQCLTPNDPRIEKCRKESDMDPYEGTFDDYLEMFIQFGYVFLFSAVYPLAGVWAVVNNLLEIRADAFKLCKVYQRPTARRVKDIGAWQIAFEIMGGIAVITNCAILSLSPTLRSYAPSMSSVEWVLLFVIIEHFLLALKFGLRELIPDVPSWVKIALARLEYQSRQALKNEQAFKARRQLTRRFKTFNVARQKKLGNTDTNAPDRAATAAKATVTKRKSRKTSGSGKKVEMQAEVTKL